MATDGKAKINREQENGGNCFLLPDELFGLGLESGEIAVYSYLLRCENRETHQCWPSYQTIAKALVAKKGIEFTSANALFSKKIRWSKNDAHKERSLFMARADEKTRTAFWIENDLLARCDVCWQRSGFASRNKFVNQAIEQYIATLTLEQADDVLIDRLAKVIAKAADDGATKISKGLFRYAVGQEMILHILTSQFGIDPNTVWDLRRLAIKNVRRTRGKVSLEAIADFQNEGSGRSGYSGEEDDER